MMLRLHIQLQPMHVAAVGTTQQVEILMLEKQQVLLDHVTAH
jgi:hypothetical protein